MRPLGDPLLVEVVSRYHGLMEQNGFGDATWAEQLQQRMRQQRLTDSGRLLSPVLRPFFVSQRQVDVLSKTSAHLSSIFDQLESIILANPALLNRLKMLPAEKSLLSVPSGYKHFSIAASLDAAFRASACIISGVDASRPSGVAYANALADAFLELPIIQEFRRRGHNVGKIPGLRRMAVSLTEAWHQFGGKGKPCVAVVDWAHTGGEGVSEGELLSDLLAAQGVNACFVPPEKLVFQTGELRSRDAKLDRKIDLVVRRILVRDLLTRWDLTHPLLEAYRSRAICMVNSFRSEIGQRRAFLELLTDESVTSHLSAVDRKLLRQSVTWTRVMSARKVNHAGEDIDLIPWVIKNREHLTLLPDQPSPELRSYAGSHMTAVAWEWAVRQAIRTSYVVQEDNSTPAEQFPFFQYGEFKLREVTVSLQAQLLGGELGDCIAVLQSKAAASITPLGIAPVLLVS